MKMMSLLIDLNLSLSFTRDINFILFEWITKNIGIRTTS